MSTAKAEEAQLRGLRVVYKVSVSSGSEVALSSGVGGDNNPRKRSAPCSLGESEVCLCTLSPLVLDILTRF